MPYLQELDGPTDDWCSMTWKTILPKTKVLKYIFKFGQTTQLCGHIK